MTDLAVALSIAGGVVIAALLAHGAWTARGTAPRRADARQRSAVEPMLDPAPSGDDDDAPAAPPPPATGGAPADAADGTASAGAPAGEPVVPAGPAETGFMLPSTSRRRAARLDALIDAIAVLRPEPPVSAELALASLPTSRRAGTKRMLIEGLRVDSGRWEPPQAALSRRASERPAGGAQAQPADVRYREFQVGVQMANRGGALNEIEYSEFVQKVQAFADAVGALVELPDMRDAVARSRELDAFAAEHDAQLAVHLRAKQVPWSLAYVQQHASQHGFIAGSVPGRLVLPSPDDGAPPMLALSYDPQAALADDPAQAVVSDLTLSFDVPQTPAAAEPFAAWQSTAQALALAMEAVIVDDQGRQLDALGFAAIGEELKRLYARLDARDLSAGSAVARRLFS